ncbi:transcription factor cropped [Dermatophagoides farinae]|uniref:Protein dimerization n=1 Tax=Dermatophagoides farinae TaxID=6954 RepID=A0A922L0M6_DERFA|nr:uncharacterized protein LOC124500060 [Dermatophagoides farinae]KAH7645571.1 transcription factor ap-4-like protein [Dermatophagoides farinae]KAH9497537.1 protein dimerization [Dermatophagoides farinae]
MSSMDGMEHNMDEKRAKREIANMNERRRMQNINAGFHSLRTLLPQKHDGEKLSKAAILQHTATYIYQLEQEINKLLSQNSELKTLAGVSATNSNTNINSPDWMKRLQSQPPDCPSCKRRKYENNHRLDIDSSPINGDGSSTESSSEHELNSNKFNRSKSKQNGNSRLSTDASALRKQLCRIEKELEDERRLRIMLQEELQYQTGKTLNGNRHYHNHSSSALEQITDEVEVASESIEIEMQSCPASPPDMVIAANEQVITTSGTTIFPTGHFQSQQIDIGQQQQRVQKQNAIALPIDVPFVAPHEVDSPTESNNIKNTSNGSVVVLVDSNVMLVESNRNMQAANTNSASNSSTNAGQKTRILQLVPNNSSSKHGGPTILTAKHSNLTMGNDCKLITIKKESLNEQANTSRQNLNTIVEAIRHVEGGYFNESADNNSKTVNKNETQDDSDQANKKIMLKTENENDNSESAKRNASDSLPKSKANVILNNISSNAKIVTVSGVSNTAASRIYHTISTANSSSPSSTTTRPQIIQIQRPNVIVANSVEN